MDDKEIFIESSISYNTYSRKMVSDIAFLDDPAVIRFFNYIQERRLVRDEYSKDVITTKDNQYTDDKKELEYSNKTKVDFTDETFVFPKFNPKNRIQLTKNQYIFLYKWFNDHNEMTSFFCKNAVIDPSRELEPYQKCMTSYPRCMDRIINKLCQCQEECISNFKHNLKRGICRLYDYNFITEDPQHFDCCWDYKYEKGEMKRITARNNLKEATDIYYEEIIRLCSDKNNFEYARCAAYELQDECFKQEDCKSNSLFFIKFENCINPFYSEQIDELKQYLNFSISHVNFYKSKKEKREISYNNNKTYELTNSRYYNFKSDFNLYDDLQYDNTDIYNLTNFNNDTSMAAFNDYSLRLIIISMIIYVLRLRM